MKKTWYKYLVREIQFWILYVRNRLQTVKWPILFVLGLSVGFVSFYHGRSWAGFEHQQLLDSLDRIAISFISAFVFFFVNIQMESEKRRIKMAPYLHNKISRLVNLRRTIFAGMRRQAGLNEAVGFSSAAELRECSRSLKLSGPIDLALPIGLEVQAWDGLFDWLVQENQETIRDLLRLKEFLRSDIIQGLLAIDDKMEVLGRIHQRERRTPQATLEAYAEILYDYKLLCEDLSLCFHNEYRLYRAEHQHVYAKARLRRIRSAAGLLERFHPPRGRRP